MIITSPVFVNNSSIPLKYTCDGLDISPPLKFEQVPDKAVSLALIVEDPDAPAGNWIHWIVFNIPPDKTVISENENITFARQGMTDFGQSGWGGPCPPSGTHRYFFRLYALNCRLELPEGSSGKIIRETMKDHVIQTAEFFGFYGRK